MTDKSKREEAIELARKVAGHLTRPTLSYRDGLNERYVLAHALLDVAGELEDLRTQLAECGCRERE